LRGLGWFSVGLGLTQIIAPRLVQRLIGVPEGNTFGMRSLGLRELVSGLGMLDGRLPEGFLGGRVVGDVMDLSLLGVALRDRHAKPARLAVTGLAVLGVTALDVWARRKLASGDTKAESLRQVTVAKSVTIDRPPDVVYAYWRDLTNIPKFMTMIESVQPLDTFRSHWKACGPLGATVEWDAELTDDKPGHLIAWRSLSDMTVKTHGQVRFVRSAGGRGTDVICEMTIDPPGGALAPVAAVLSGGLPPGMQLVADLRRLKQLLELGEIVKSDASIHHGPHPAAPAKRGEQ
jgi:uncharacterized membrane protein